jgi:hypothetical protein
MADRRRPAYLTHQEAADTVNLQQRGDVPATIEAIARAVACGELDTRVGNAVVVAANVAVQALDSADRSIAKRAGAMSDEELDAEIEVAVIERIRRRNEGAEASQ